jgi:hypothetical protein
MISQLPLIDDARPGWRCSRCREWVELGNEVTERCPAGSGALHRLVICCDSCGAVLDSAADLMGECPVSGCHQVERVHLRVMIIGRGVK